MQDGFGPNTAICMVRMIGWMDDRKFARVFTESDTDITEIFHVSGDAQSREKNVVYLLDLSHNELANQIRNAKAAIDQAGCELPHVSRESILRLKSTLSSQLGTEGCKRFCEYSSISFRRLEDSMPGERIRVGSEFWDCFRTFLDVDRVAGIGRPFKVEHYRGMYFVINDHKGTRVQLRENGGASLNFAALAQTARPQRDIR